MWKKKKKKNVVLCVGARRDSSFNRVVKTAFLNMVLASAPEGSHRGGVGCALPLGSRLCACAGTWAGTTEPPLSADRPRMALAFLHSSLLWEACDSSIAMPLSKQIKIEEKGALLLQE